jgi:tetratricopeptide (TPR) repeat protein
MPVSSILRAVTVLLVLGAVQLAACGGAGPKGAAAPEPGPARLSEEPFEKSDMILVIAATMAIDDGNPRMAIQLLEQLAERYPGHRVIVHELALAYRVMGEPGAAIELLGPYEDQLNAQMAAALGSAHSEAGDLASAMAIFGRAIERHPESGLLHSEIGTVLSKAGKPLEAIASYEKGMEVEPAWPSNYLNAARIYSETDHRGYTLIYGEIFRILEPRSERSEKLAILMADTMSRAVTVEKKSESDISMRISLAPAIDVRIDGSPGGGEPEVSIEVPLVNAFEGSYGICLFDVFRYGVSIARLHEARSRFLDIWWAEGGLHTRYDFPLADWLRRLREAGHLEAYEHWLYGPAFKKEYDLWAASREGDLERLVRWMKDNPLFDPDATGEESEPSPQLQARRLPVARAFSAVR